MTRGVVRRRFMAIRAGSVVAIFLLVSHFHGPVEAYLDPGTGSIVLQAVLGGVVGVLTLLKMYWHRVKRFVTRRSSQPHATLED
jgi:hypothetical protein